MSENDVPYSSGCFAAGLFLFVHVVLLIVFIKFHIGLFFPVFLILEFIVQIIATFFVGRRISWLRENAEKERLEGLRVAAKEMNFSFSLEGDTRSFGRLRHYSHLLSQGGGSWKNRNVQRGDTWKVRNVMQGNIDDIDVTLLDYEQYASSRGLFIPGFGKWVENRWYICQDSSIIPLTYTDNGNYYAW